MLRWASGCTSGVEEFGVGLGILAIRSLMRSLGRSSRLCTVILSVSVASLWLASFVHFSACRVSLSISPHLLAP